MTGKDNGGPAFSHGNPTDGGEEGMSLRDYFAAKAMQGLVTAGKYTVGMDQKTEAVQYAEKAYRIADCMLREARK